MSAGNGWAMSAWNRWVALLSRREAGTGLALFRIAIGLCVLGTIGTVVGHDLVGVLWVDRSHDGYRTLGAGPWLVALLGGPTPRVVWSLVVLTLAAGLAMVLGMGARLAALVALQGVLALTWLNPHAGGSYDDLLTNALWLLVLGDAGATLSLSCRLRTGRWTSDRTVPAWPRWLAVLQLILAYASTGMQKLSVYWVPGGDFSALYYILQQPSWQRTDMRWVADWFPLTQVATALTWAWEVSSPLVLLTFWARADPARGGRLRGLLLRLDYRRPFALVGLAMHLSTLVLMNVGPFSAITLSYYLCLWSPDELAALGRLRRPASAMPPRPAQPSPSGSTTHPGG